MNAINLRELASGVDCVCHLACIGSIKGIPIKSVAWSLPRTGKERHLPLIAVQVESFGATRRLEGWVAKKPIQPRVKLWICR